MRILQLTLVFAVVAGTAARGLLKPTIVAPNSFTKLRASNNSTLFSIDLPKTAFPYADTPLLVDLHGTHWQVGYDYAALLFHETQHVYTSLMGTLFPKDTDRMLVEQFVDFCWASFLSKYTPAAFLDELEGMREFEKTVNAGDAPPPSVVSHRTYTLANMPADTQNIIAMLEEELEPASWPLWLRVSINEIIKLLEKYIHGCDAFGVWGSRTDGGRLFSSRNLDWNANTGMNKYVLVTMFHLPDAHAYATLGYASGLAALAGMSAAGVTVSEMNLDNSRVTFSGPPFPLRLREVLEKASDLESAMAVWEASNNTNSFNFLIASAADAEKGSGPAALALETVRGFTGVFGDNSDIERDATYFCANDECRKWTTQTGLVKIGKPLPEAVWRANHGMHPEVMLTQEPLFNNTMLRYNLLHDAFASAAAPLVAKDAVAIAATLGTKGPDYFSCDQDFSRGDNVMSIAYAPAVVGNSGKLYVAWEGGSGKEWRPAACMPYVEIDFARWM